MLVRKTRPRKKVAPPPSGGGGMQAAREIQKIALGGPGAIPARMASWPPGPEATAWTPDEGGAALIVTQGLTPT
eukprot:CAMPEP_0179274606 /NCGR_PEP_ID=MMETSP0797-20121207/33616_1 /TAXON_ID=47934 /ORGANISM="Dinophysis acuminata, Strain DAEP01" /LENGTH=73 /DNA_ID=CAMNT_0020983071 /DNA_START=74 /DNA_END=291 /DNA_ORIENTATION=-